MEKDNQNSAELWGRKFRIVESGLDRGEVTSFLSRLVEENRELTDRLEHIEHLKKLAERVIVEASKMADNTLTKAEEERRHILNEARKQAEKEAEAIKYEAEQLMQKRLKTAEDKIKAELKQLFESIDFNFVSFRETGEIVLTESRKAVETEERKTQEPKPQVASQVQTLCNERERELTITESGGKRSVSATGDRRILPGNKDDDSSSLYEGMVELLIPQLMGMDQIFRLHKSLKNIPNIKVMNFRIADDKQSVIFRLFLESPLPLLQVLASLPEVQSVSNPLQQEVYDKSSGDGSNTRRILVSISTRN